MEWVCDEEQYNQQQHQSGVKSFPHSSEIPDYSTINMKMSWHGFWLITNLITLSSILILFFHVQVTTNHVRIPTGQVIKGKKALLPTSKELACLIMNASIRTILIEATFSIAFSSPSRADRALRTYSLSGQSVRHENPRTTWILMHPSIHPSIQAKLSY